MLPTIAIVGRPNVGKSTLFNRLTRSRDALVFDEPGLTRDRHYGRARQDDREFLVVDTGGFEPVATTGILHEMARQAKAAIAESDAVVFLVDARSGLTPQDQAIAELLRRSGRPVVVAVNKAEGLQPAQAVAEFHELGLGEPVAISAAHGENVRDMVAQVLEHVPQAAPRPGPQDDLGRRVKVAVVGRPNVGKSTLVNTLLGEERVIAFDEPGTTRDAIYLDFDRGERAYTLIDTAGVRRRGKVEATVEKFSVIKTLQKRASPSRTAIWRDTSSRLDARWWLASTSGMRQTSRHASVPSASCRASWASSTSRPTISSPRARDAASTR